MDVIKLMNPYHRNTSAVQKTTATITTFFQFFAFAPSITTFIIIMNSTKTNNIKKAVNPILFFPFREKPSYNTATKPLPFNDRSIALYFRLTYLSIIFYRISMNFIYFTNICKSSSPSSTGKDTTTLYLHNDLLIFLIFQKIHEKRAVTISF